MSNMLLLTAENAAMKTFRTMIWGVMWCLVFVVIIAPAHARPVVDRNTDLADLSILVRKCSHDTEREAELIAIRDAFPNKQMVDDKIAAISARNGWKAFCASVNEKIGDNAYDDYITARPAMELSIERWDMSELPYVRAAMTVHNRTRRDYDSITWKCDFYNKKTYVGSTVIVTEDVPQVAAGQISQTFYQKYLFDDSTCAPVRATRLPWER